MAIKRNGFTLENDANDQYGNFLLDAATGGMGMDQPPTDTERLVELVNRLLANYGQRQVPPGLKGADLLNELDGIVSRIESTVLTPAAKVAMANRNRKEFAPRIPTDAEVAARLRAKGIDPKFMPVISR